MNILFKRPLARTIAAIVDGILIYIIVPHLWNWLVDPFYYHWC